MEVLYFLIALLVLAIMIFVHELGHYTAGRLLGFRILDFSLGFGPALLLDRLQVLECVVERVAPNLRVVRLQPR